MHANRHAVWECGFKPDGGAAEMLGVEERNAHHGEWLPSARCREADQTGLLGKELDADVVWSGGKDVDIHRNDAGCDRNCGR